MFWNDSNIILLGNFILWLFTFIIYQKRKSTFDVGSFLLLFYLSIVIVGFYVFNHPLAKVDFKEVSLFPFVYLYAMLMLATYPLLKFDSLKVNSISNPNDYKVNTISIIVIIAILFQIPDIISNFSTGLSSMLVDDSGGAELYSEMISNYDKAGDGKIENLASIFSNVFSDISIFLFFYCLTLERKNKFILIGLFISIVLTMLSIISSGGRGGVVNILLTVLTCYILFKNFLSLPIRKRIFKIMVITMLLISFPVILITISRFGQGNTDMGYANAWYYGQSYLNFNNYGIDAGGIRNGDRTASFFKGLFVDDMPKNYLERRQKYFYMKMDESVFYTFVGDFTLDYGAIVTAFIFLLFSFLFVRKTKVIGNTIQIHQLFLLFFILCVCVQGQVGLFTFADVGGNLKIIAFILVYFWFKLNIKPHVKKYEQ